METTFRISSAATTPETLKYAGSVFGRLSDMLCRECGKDCKGFLLTDEFDQYQAHGGPKIGWVVDGQTILLRMANCDAVQRIDRISQFLRLFDMTVLDSRLVH